MRPSRNDRYSFVLLATLWIVCDGPLIAQQTRNCDLKFSQTVPTSATATSNFALVIGNAHYTNEKLRLDTPVEDACAMGQAFADLGYDVIFRQDTNSQQLRDAVQQFGSTLKKATVGIFYYAGHAAQVNGENYLVPTDGDMSAADALKSTSVRFDSVVSGFRVGSTTTNIAILDACRNNPLPHTSGGLGSRSSATI